MDPARSSRIGDVRKTLTSNQELMRNLFVVGGFSLAGTLFQILFQLSMARYLGSHDYSVLGTFSAILFTVILLSGSIYFIIARFVTYHHTRYQYEQINYLVRASLKYFFAVGFVAFLIVLIFSEQIAIFFHIDSVGPVIMFGFAMWLQLLVPVYESAFKGLENLGAMGRLRLIESGSRLLIALVFAYLALRTTAMVFALGLGTFVALALTYSSIRDLQRLHIVRPNMQEIWEYAKPVLLISATMALLLNLDVIVVKHLFSPEQAGVYAAASLLAKVPFLMSWIFSTVLFPRVIKLHADGLGSSHLLRVSLKWMAAIVVVSTVLNALFANTIFAGIFGSDTEAANYIVPYAFAMGLLALANLLVTYQLALRKFTLAKIVPWFLVLEIVLLYFFHASVLHVVVVTMLVTALLSATTVYVLRNELQLERLVRDG